MRFSDLDGDKRMEYRARIEKTGAQVVGYYGAAVQVALPSDKPTGRTIFDIESCGFREKGGHYFPLGTDAPPDVLRHFGPGTPAAPRGDRPAYWLYWNFELYVHPELQVEVILPELTQ